MAHQIFPSILAADLGNLQQVCELINNSEADGFHLDVMDGLFVPNISFGFPVIKAIQRYAAKPLDVHLMIVQPERYLERFRDVGATILTVHLEACNDLPQTIERIKELGMKVCIAIKPQTDVSMLQAYLPAIHSVCIMSVNPGFGGQLFMEETYQRIEALKVLIAGQRANVLIKVDGGIDEHNGSKLIATGADILVAGTAIFAADDPLKAIALFKRSRANTIS
jgi:ribulose-phosphate 3-epimerase